MLPLSIIIELLVRLVGQEEEQQFRLQVFKTKFREKFSSGLILVMLVYYGLVVILALGLFIYWYDRAYNTNDDAFDN